MTGAAILGVVLGGRGASAQEPTSSAAGGPVIALIEAAKRSDLVATRALLAEGADVNAADVLGRTALHYASSIGDAGIVESLLSAADPNLQDKEGFSPLHRAGQNGRDAIAALLLAAGASKTITNGAGKTPSGLAAENNHSKLAEDLKP